VVTLPRPHDDLVTTYVVGGRHGHGGSRCGVNGGVRIGDVEIRPLGGGLGCLLMILASLALSVLATVFLNLVLR
jgi:hypothetical protein